ncbi:fatty acid desaturase family protein [Thiosocius teredinicola]|uniref:fatty acid desaturase family protein n=1 Tax=Thiosocius teredinicola TaxID=1973002 RepID=UPI00099127D8
MNSTALRSTWPIPVRLNIVIAVLSWSAAAGFLWLASHAQFWWHWAVACVGFALINNTIFSLLHEAVHGVLHPNRRVNDALGRVSAAFFPTGFIIQRVCHLGHHRRNRTDVELYDYCPPGTPMWLATFRLFCLLGGFYWLSVPLANLLYIAGVVKTRLFREKIAEFYGMRPMVEDVCKAPSATVVRDILLSAGIQVALFILLDLSLLGWLACYWSFAMVWCAVQYATHAWTPRDIRNGAWNLRISAFTRAVFLNYHYHLAHHQYPAAPWNALPKLIDHSLRRPGWARIYWSLWLGPRHTDEPDPGKPSPELERDLEQAL